MSEILELRQVVLKRLFVVQLALLAAFLCLVTLGYLFPEQLGSFIFSFIIGCLAASVAVVRRLRKISKAMLEESARSWVTTLMPLLYGGLLAGVAYLLFLSGILSGDGGKGLFTSNLFPNFTAITPQPGQALSIRDLLAIRPASLQDLGKLWIWSFIAGYSEGFVISILGRLEKRGSDDEDHR